MSAFNRTLAIEIIVQQAWASRNKATIATLHLHHRCAKSASGFAEGNNTWCSGFGRILQRHDVDLICVDFDMSLWRVAPLLSAKRQVAPPLNLCVAVGNDKLDRGGEGLLQRTTSTLAVPPPAEHP